MPTLSAILPPIGEEWGLELETAQGNASTRARPHPLTQGDGSDPDFGDSDAVDGRAFGHSMATSANVSIPSGNLAMSRESHSPHSRLSWPQETKSGPTDLPG